MVWRTTPPHHAQARSLVACTLLAPSSTFFTRAV
jgi:hypothetical protein